MFKSAILKLTSLYLLILLAVSIFFSFSLYHISSNEVDNRLRRQVDFLNTRPLSGQVFDLIPFEQQRRKELNNSNHAVIVELIYANIAILFFGGFGSYLLAKKTLKPIEEAHASQARFAADASHELRTPIAAMRSETEVALRDPKLTIKEARGLLASNVEELERLGNLSEGLLALARSGADTPMDELVSIKDAVQTAVGQISRAAKTKQITIETGAVKDATVCGNQTQLVQLLYILIDNAVKYSDKKSTITLTAQASSDKVSVAVIDHGHGISPDDLAHIFDRFYRADNARSQQHASGYGLGLSIAKQIVRAHQGHIEATSTPGAGSTFTVVLPTARN